jgi:hypothetical protein
MLGAKGPGNVTEWRVDTVEPFDSKEFQRIGIKNTRVEAFLKAQLADAFVTTDRDHALSVGFWLGETHPYWSDFHGKLVDMWITVLDYSATDGFPV